MAEPATPIKAIVSDFGGVLTTPLLASFLALQDEIGISAEHFGTALRTSAEEDGENPLFAMERGEITEAAFLDRARPRPRAAARPPARTCTASASSSSARLDPNPPMIDLMRELKAAGLRMAMLTNNVRSGSRCWRTMLPVDEIFEMVVDSGFVGCRKPEPRIYEITLRAARPARRGLPLRRRPPRQLRRRPGARLQRGPLPRATSRRSPRSAPRSRPGARPERPRRARARAAG